jgi:glycosyltransferase involved in cell wall biosynthesis
LQRAGSESGAACDLQTPVIIFQHNVESQIWKRHSETATNPVKRAIFRKQWRMTCDWEKKCAGRVAGQVTVSEDDTKFFREQLAMKNILGAVPTGVDTEYFSPTNRPKTPRSLVFLGAMDWMPNIDAVCWFEQEIFPRVRKHFREAHLTIVGRNPTERVKSLASLRAQIRVTGTVDDVRPFLGEAEAMIVPLRVGGGTRIKIYEGMAMGIPVVSTTIGAEGLAVKHGENILLADSAEDFAKAICDLFSNNELRGRIGGNALEMVRCDCSWESITKVFEKYCHDVCRTRRAAA